MVITGANSGIGYEAALQLARKGASVVLACRSLDKANAAAQQIKSACPAASVEVMELDLSSLASVRSFAESFHKSHSRLDVLCNNAGIECYRRPEEYTLDDWNDISETNLRGAFLCTKYAHPFLKERRGCIIHISSVQAFANESRISAYTATKAGLLGLTRSMALDFAAEGIRVNAVCPGAIQTGMMEASLDSEADPEEAVKRIGRSIPLGRIGQPADIAKAVYFLASPDASYVTGATLVVDGGLLTRLSI